MASFSVPCPKITPLLSDSSHSRTAGSRHCTASFSRSDSRPVIVPLQQGPTHNHSAIFKVYAQLSEVAVEKPSNSIPALELVLPKESERKLEVPDASSISAFMNDVANLVGLVDSRDIVELQLKQMDGELLIRKKETLPQPSVAAPIFYPSPLTHQATLPPQMPHANVPAPASVGSAPSTPAVMPTPAPAPTKPKSAHPPFKCPMAGNFYRSPAPGAPPFVKVGDKIQKGQVICIIEAMKLMNEIETDISGTIVEILVEDGKPVSVDMPLFTIEP
ncbi:LOW QUALITY PROTEIN: biotin carboxyl carrier protein of acetyl-CoA carboxylase 2, chloroplastic-like [Primulina eburnea]|uniref:LOW QUALITY PROTEIN: biotin carboxyl carrier protein of acetyl-CoA carboxylase 2, chloroplastic-like n=1 Tax=Primulina eburnea TaxID=1245227 RepID=UPI003C6BF13F